MLGDTTKISQIMFKLMMQAFGTDKNSFQQPNSVYRVGNELYIKGGNPNDVPSSENNDNEKKQSDQLELEFKTTAKIKVMGKRKLKTNGNKQKIKGNTKANMVTIDHITL